MIRRLIFLLLAFHVCNLYAQTCNEVSVYFKPNKHTLTSQDVTEIQRTIVFMQPFTFHSIRIEGYCDTTGTEKSNSILSQKRIDSTQCALKLLIDTTVHIATINHGESDPLSLTDLSKNRRVRIVFVLDTLVNLVEKGKGEIWLNTKSFFCADSCHSLRIVPQIDFKYTPFIPMGKDPEIYQIYVCHQCLFGVYYFPKKFYNPLTHIGWFPRHIKFRCDRSDSINFSQNADQMQYDSTSESYYIIYPCYQYPGVCCDTRPNCTSFVFVPEETNTHKTSVRFYDHKAHQADTLFVSDSLVWKDWQCFSEEDSAGVYSIAMFDSTYCYLKGEIDKYRKKDTLSFEMNGEEYKYNSASNIYFLKQRDYTSFSSPTKNRLVVKAPRGYVPGFYLKDYNVIIPFEYIRKRKYKGYVIDYPFEFGLQHDTATIGTKELKVKKRIKKSKTVAKIKLSKPYKDSLKNKSDPD
jgi:hypothetical protein